MKILDIYKQYQIMPQLQEHMLRVAGVADFLSRGITRMATRNNAESIITTDYHNIVTACLLHDMGNIIKFDLSQSKKLINHDLDLKYWGEVQKEFREKYGTDEHIAHTKIAEDIGVSKRVVELINAVSFLGASSNASGNDFGKKIIQYADDRVSPFGVVSLEERLADLRARYAHHGGQTPERDAFENALRQMEKQIFEYCLIKPEDITEEKVGEKLEILRNYNI